MIGRTERGTERPEKETQWEKEVNRVWSIIKPLYFREADVWQIVNLIPDLDPRSVSRVIEDKSAGRFGIGFGNRKGQERGEDFIPSSQKVVFARNIFEAGFIGENSSPWVEYHNLFLSNSKKVPTSIYDNLRLEMMYSAVMLDLLGDGKRLEAYESIGNEVDAKWFSTSLTKEETFIAAKLEEQVERMYGSGRRTFIPLSVDDENHEVKADNTEEALKRLKSRWEIIGPSPPLSRKLSRD